MPLIRFFCPDCARPKLGPLHILARTFRLCPRTWR